MNPFRRFLDFISYPSHSRTIGFLAFLVVLLAVPLTVNIAQKQQELRQRAAFNEGGGATQQTCTTVPVNVEKCLYPDTMPSNCHAGGSQDCSTFTQIAGRPNAVSAICGEAQQTCVPTPTTAPTKPTCESQGYQCTGGQTCIQVDGGTPTSDYTCSQQGTVCCKSAGSGRSITTCKSGTTITCLDPHASSTPSEACYRVGVTPDCGEDKISYCCPSSTGTGSGGGTCDANSPGVWRYACKTSDCPSGHHAIRVCSNGQQWPDTTCYPGTNVSGSNCSTGGTGGSGACDANCTAANGKLCQNNQCSDIPNTITCSTTPTCSSGTLYNFPNNKFGCLASANNWISPTCGSGPSTGTVGTGTQISFTIGLDGIGSAGDSQHPSPSAPPGAVCKPGFSASVCGSNQDPKRKSRTLFYQVFTDSSKSKVLEEGQTTITYNNFGVFVGSVLLKNTLTNGTNYPIKARSDGFLARVDNVAIANNSGLVKLVGQGGNLVNGNLVGGTNRQVGPLDFNQFNPCYGKPAPASGICSLADLNDDGTVDIIDFNLFLREFNQQETD